MKALVAVLVLLAAFKVGTQQYLVATAKSEIIVAAYQGRAMGACERASKMQKVALTGSWAQPSEIRLVIGKSSLDVQLWQIDHALWNARFKNPYLFLTLREAEQAAFCEFDIVQGVASVFRL